MNALTKRKNYGSLGRFGNVFDVFSKEVDDLFHSFGLSTLGSVEGCSYIAPAEVVETDGDYNINVELPGIKKEDVNISVANDKTLVVSGKKEETKTEDDGNVYFSEFCSGSFHREFRLPETADKESIEAKSENGILSIRIPKKEKEKPKEIKIDLK
jgi:HSP20 family protein